MTTTEQRRRALRMVALSAAVDAINDVQESQRGQADLEEIWDEWCREIDTERDAAYDRLNTEIEASDEETKTLFHALRKKN